MPNKASAAKRARQNLKRRTWNRAARSAMRTAIKKAKDTIESNENAAPVLSNAQSVVAKMAKRRIVHPRKAARITSRLMKMANKAASATPESA